MFDGGGCIDSNSRTPSGVAAFKAAGFDHSPNPPLNLVPREGIEPPPPACSAQRSTV